MSCPICRKTTDTPNRVLLNTNGDFACSEECAIEYRKRRDYFFNVVVHDDAVMSRWWRGEDYPIVKEDGCSSSQ